MLSIATDKGQTMSDFVYPIFIYIVWLNLHTLQNPFFEKDQTGN